jgi:hypothetical protein
VTHDREEAFRLADQLVVLVDGVVLAAGPKSLVYRSPGNREVAELLGYTVLAHRGGLVAVPPSGLHLGRGTPGFVLTAERVVDMGNHLHLIGRIGQARVNLRLAPCDTPPPPGAVLDVHAPGCVTLP